MKGDDAPLASQLKQWLESHPGWEILVDSEDENEEDEEDLDDENLSRDSSTSNLSFKELKKVSLVKCKGYIFYFYFCVF